ncbi:aminotriazole resistance protein [Cohnella sp. AR92]|uniref:aminotriazole resistance protein n=1 Tax=Cohnella sp. AR92 TaxID=648716 RepID=UPI000F8C4168|nr:aminotriazole resistance protein [Cohnella sp. AR92]RUS47076.1 aminotriazole resistance protein [Cohnella sp. AR92]
MSNEWSTAKTETRTSSAGIVNIVFWVIFGVMTGVLWAYANPIALVPGVIQLRIFAFLPAVIGILFGPKTGFFSGYIGTVVWALLAGTFLPAHTLLADGIMVGFTGWLPAMMVGRGRTLAELGRSKSVLVQSALWSLAAGIVMIVIACASLHFFGIFNFWWGVLWIGLSDVPPLVIGTPILVLFLARRLEKVQTMIPWS